MDVRQRVAGTTQFYERVASMHTNGINYDAVREKSIEFMLSRHWKQATGKLKQFNQRPLDHSLVVLDAMFALWPVLRPTLLPQLSEKVEQVLLAGVIAPDVLLDEPPAALARKR